MLELGLWDTPAPRGRHGRAGGGGQKAPQASRGASLGYWAVYCSWGFLCDIHMCLKGKGWTLKNVEKEGYLGGWGCPNRCNRNQGAARVARRLVGGRQDCGVW